MNQKLKSIAYHEAGHAVVQRYLGLAVKKVTVVKDQDCLGAMHGKMATNHKIEYDLSDRVRLNAERDVIVLLAGMAAQREFAPRSVRFHHGHSDYKKAIRILDYIAGNRGELKAYFKYLEIRTKNLMKRPQIRIAIEGLAKELLIHKTLDGKQVVSIIAKSLGFSKAIQAGLKIH